MPVERLARLTITVGEREITCRFTRAATLAFREATGHSFLNIGAWIADEDAVEQAILEGAKAAGEPVQMDALRAELEVDDIANAQVALLNMVTAINKRAEGNASDDVRAALAAMAQAQASAPASPTTTPPSIESL